MYRLKMSKLWFNWNFRFIFICLSLDCLAQNQIRISLVKNRCGRNDSSFTLGISPVNFQKKTKLYLLYSKMLNLLIFCWRDFLSSKWLDFDQIYKIQFYPRHILFSYFNMGLMFSCYFLLFFMFCYKIEACAFDIEYVRENENRKC